MFAQWAGNPSFARVTDPKIWMPLYIGDYLGDTIGLTNAEHGGYFLAMCSYWRKGESLTDPELRQVAGKQYARVSAFFVFCDGRWHHARIDRELKAARDRMEAARAKALKGVAARQKNHELT